MASLSTLAQRLLFGALMILAFAGVLIGEGYLACHDYYVLSDWSDGLGLALLAGLLAAGGCAEFVRLAGVKGARPSQVVMIAVIMVLVTQPFWAGRCPGGCRPDSIPMGMSLAGVLLAGLFAAAVVQGRQGTDGTLVNLGVCCLGIIYLGLGGWFIVAIRRLGAGEVTIWGQIGGLVTFLACVKSADIGAYFTGRFFGRHKWVRSISPAKTWEGFFGGVGLAIIVASLISGISGTMSLGMAVVFGLVVGIAGQLGDLLESMLKRDAGDKDSGQLVPQFGGILDLLDSVLVAAPLAYLVLARAGRFCPEI